MSREVPNILMGPPAPAEALVNLNKSLGQYLADLTKNIENQPYLIDAKNGRVVTVGEVMKDSYKLAGQLQAIECKPGDLVAIICENRVEYPVILFAIFHVGAIPVCFNPNYTPGELTHTLNVAKPSYVFASSKCCRKVNDLRHNLQGLKCVINIDRTQEKGCLSYYNLRDQYYQTVEKDFCDTAMILFSSGSTGLPKGVMIYKTSFIFLLDIIRVGQMLKDEAKEVLLSVIPMFHGYGILLLFRTLISGDSMVILNRFEENIFLQCIQKYKVTSLMVVPYLMVFLVKNILVKKYDLSSIKQVSCGAAPLSKNVEEKVKEMFNLKKVNKGYGMTETTIVATINVFTDIPGTVGTILPGLMAKIIDLESGIALKAGVCGEICLKGLLIMKGYYNNEKETNEMIDEDGWLHTGDIGYYDDTDNVFIVDRVKDLIKYKGFQVPPMELESLLMKHEGIKEAAVVGIPNEETGELPKAFVVKQPLAKITEQEIVEYIEGKVSSQCRLRGGVTFINEIPRNPAGKVLRRVLKEKIVSKL